jgi:ribosomal protein L11 methyltransferase
MPWLELSVTVTAEQQQRVELALEDLGALTVTLQDADADTPDEQAIFEPGVGETPLWSQLVVQALFPLATDRAGLLAALHDAAPELAPEQVSLRDVADQDWTRAWMADFKPMRFGARLWIVPTGSDDAAAAADAAIVRLDPGLAFGTGTHPTTALCLEWLDAAELAGKTVIDYGCGSGVLAVAAVKLGATHVVAIDNDAQALQATRDNALRNGVTDAIETCLPDAVLPLHADTLLANILVGPLLELAPRFAAALPPGGALVLSGILAGQEDDVLERYADAFDAFEVTRRDDWMRIAARRRG